MMADTQEFGIGLIGLGIGQQHLLGYQRRGLRVAAICDKDATRLNEVGNTFGIDKYGLKTLRNGIISDQGAGDGLYRHYYR